MNCLEERVMAGVCLNDVHSKLNSTWVREVRAPENLEELRLALAEAKQAGRKVSCCGGRHAMGGQQFGEGNLQLDLSGVARVISLDRVRGIVEVEAGIQWRELIEWLEREQSGSARAWGIRQKQTGADRLSVGGALAANAHGRGLMMRPMIDDVEGFTLLMADGDLIECSRTENYDLFRLAIGGYGLFGIIYSVRLRLMVRRRVRRVVKLTTTENLEREFQERIERGFLFGDFQFAIDSASRDFLRLGVFSCYEPVGEGGEEAASAAKSEDRQLTPGDWKRLLLLAHCDPSAGFRQYADYYLSTNGQVYWSDRQQLGYYCDDYHREIDRICGCSVGGSEMITELYVPRWRLGEFMARAREWLRDQGAQVIYGTVRLIRADRESFLAWAKEDYACVVLNLHCVHDASSLAKVGKAFRGLIDLALEMSGSFYLTYHRFATREQVLAAYPQMPEFLEWKRRVDPEEIFESEWYRWIRMLMGDFDLESALLSNQPHFPKIKTLPLRSMS